MRILLNGDLKTLLRQNDIKEIKTSQRPGCFYVVVVYRRASSHNIFFGVECLFLQPSLFSTIRETKLKRKQNDENNNTFHACQL